MKNFSLDWISEVIGGDREHWGKEKKKRLPFYLLGMQFVWHLEIWKKYLGSHQEQWIDCGKNSLLIPVTHVVSPTQTQV